jgi:peptide-methionine (R)-S-oxide reductase
MSRMDGSRRQFLVAGSVAAAALVLEFRRGGEQVHAQGSAAPKLVKVVAFSPDGKREQTATVPMVIKTDDEWRQQLGPEAFHVAREAGTERPYSGAYWNLHDKGLFRCVCCDTALFSSETKFDSGTGWPSFWAPIAKENVRESEDDSLMMQRIAVSCRRCEAHLGHVFNDGPRPTGLRYCMNSVSLKFEKLA